MLSSGFFETLDFHHKDKNSLNDLQSVWTEKYEISPFLQLH